MSYYVPHDDVQNAPLPNAIVIQTDRVVRVTYAGDHGHRFTVRMVQKPNPIGFRAKLPGDRK
jgi:hypothetical protein